ncbi:MAG: helix-turn-helix domain-containing protein [Candidatus Diapherotrites archaeon]|nr:helix-turn-helix domain-containing protein [Candidatus Diapherotrites archaeon]MDZ4256136.1 helix-turn-helix domain-containing protein [archaeon]
MAFSKRKKDEKLTIFIGGDMKGDLDSFLDNPKKGMRQPDNILYVQSYSQLFKALSASRLDLLKFLIDSHNQGQEQSVGEIARKLDRKQEAISRDLQVLRSMRMIDVRKSNRKVFPYTCFDGIEIRMNPIHS